MWREVKQQKNKNNKNKKKKNKNNNKKKKHKNVKKGNTQTLGVTRDTSHISVTAYTLRSLNTGRASSISGKPQTCPM